MDDDKSLTQSQRQLILDISQDFWRYADNNLWIKDKDANIVPFKPNLAQQILIEYILHCISVGVPVRVIILKARQMGLSTAVEAVIYWWVTTHRNITAMIVGHEDTSSKNLYKMFRRYYENCNPIFKPSVKYDTRNDLEFSKLDDEGKQIGLGSVIKTATAANTAVGRSDTIQILHGSEIGEWANGEELVASLLQTVPVRPNTMIFLESTANGRGNFFYKQWTSSVKGETVFQPFFFPWWLHQEYEMDGKIEEYTDEEKDIIEIMREGITIFGKHYKVNPRDFERKLVFRRYKEREFRATPEKLYQEYPSTAHEAFIATGRPVFDLKALSHMEKNCVEPKRYELKQALDRSVTVQESDDLAPLKIWEEVIPYEEYVIGADVAEGVKGGDFSVADVIKKSNMETVARFRGHIDPDLFGHLLDKLGRYYNDAFIGVEINNHGLAVVQRLRDLFYTNLYKREKGIDENFETSTSKLGWKTDMRTKPLAIDYLAEAIRDRYIIDRDLVFIEEAFSYVRDDQGRTNAEIGNHDDTVMAKAIALQLFEWSNTNKADLKVYKPAKMLARKKKNKVVR